MQRVSEARVTSGERTLGEIDGGLLVLLGATGKDDSTIARRLALKTARLRIFGDAAGKMNRSLVEVGGSALVVSQFTLYADPAGGNRPSFAAAARPEHAEPLYLEYVAALRGMLPRVETGEFGAMMRVASVNDGPVTIWLDSERL